MTYCGILENAYIFLIEWKAEILVGTFLGAINKL